MNGHTRIAVGAAALALLILLAVAVPLAMSEPFVESDRLSQVHAWLWLAFFSPLMLFPAMGHLLDRLVPLASDDPRIALIPHFGLMLVLWTCTFWAFALGVRALWRSNRRHVARGDA
jgi:hypothetical protein